MGAAPGSRREAGRIARLVVIPKVKRLRLDRTPVTNDGLKHLGKLTQLERLTLKGTKISDQGLVHLRGLHRLREIDLSQSKIEGPGLLHLVRTRESSRLRRLNLERSGITDQGIESVKRLVGLEELDQRRSHD